MPARKEMAANLPRHVGIIMDGNGRWAVSRSMKRSQGHSEGLKAAKRVVKAANDMGLPCLTLYVFSTENWKRAEEEVSFLMTLIAKHLESELGFYEEEGIRIFHSGDARALPAKVRAAIEKVVSATAGHEGMSLNLAINYGGRDEIARAAARCAARGVAPAEEAIRTALDAPGLPDVDLVVRTAGEKRISNFMLWQSAYAELHFSDKLWPDWGEADLASAIEDYSRRSRRFGGTP